jgi:hypothetical protein
VRPPPVDDVLLPVGMQGACDDLVSSREDGAGFDGRGARVGEGGLEERVREGRFVQIREVRLRLFAE